MANENSKSVTNGAGNALSPSENGKARFERERLTRREVFARFGFRAAAVAVAALTADDLLRKVGEEMGRRAGDSKVANSVAREFRTAGVAFAGGPSGCTEGCGECEESDEIECVDCSAECPTATGPKKRPKPKPCVNKSGKCVGPDCLKDMPLCGCTCTEGTSCQDCCDTACAPGIGSASDRTLCYEACQNG